MNKKTAKKKCVSPAKKAAFKQAVKQARKTKDEVRSRLARVKDKDPALSLEKFVKRVNKIAERYLPPGRPIDGRVTAEFSVRTVRHYQSKGIIDPPEKDGKEARYRYRHVLQAVLTRVMLADGFRVPMIHGILSEKTIAEYEELLEIGPMMARKIARKMAHEHGGHRHSQGCEEGASSRSAWVRLEVAPGIEVHLSRGMELPGSREEGRELLEKISHTIRGEFQRRRRRKSRRAES